MNLLARVRFPADRLRAAVQGLARLPPRRRVGADGGDAVAAVVLPGTSNLRLMLIDEAAEDAGGGGEWTS